MSIRKSQLTQLLSISIVLAFLYYTSLYNYLLFHTLAEFFSICIAFTIFVITWNSKKFLKNNLLIILGIAYLFIGGLDLLHTLSYKGMNIFTDYDYYANQLWIATRFVESITILSSFFLIKYKKTLNFNFLFILYSTITSLIIFSIFIWKTFPVCFIDDTGLTEFKVVSEYVISTILLSALIVSYFYRAFFNKQIYQYISISIIFTILSELSFTFYISNYGFSNLVGHFFKIISFYLIYKAIIEKAIKEPHETIFNDLQKQVVTDGLTGLYNHRYLYDKLIEEIQLSRRTDIPFSIILFDVDFFKNINDTYGHVQGDEALKSIATILKTNTRLTDIVGRYGGEEFLIILPNTNKESAYHLAEKIRKEISKADFCENATKISLSGGIAEFNSFFKGDESQIHTILARNLVDQADSYLYKAKSSGRDKVCM